MLINRSLCDLLSAMVYEKRQHERPKMRFEDNIEDNVENTVGGTRYCQGSWRSTGKGKLEK